MMVIMHSGLTGVSDESIVICVLDNKNKTWLDIAFNKI